MSSSPSRHIVCLGKYFETAINWYKNNEGMDYLGQDLWIDTSKRKFMMKKLWKRTNIHSTLVV